ncbi:MAG TPA: hypothetical protein VEB64_04385 [Azospirillaceae bacterium]|nr:hypothetical protein [Azospirillaceae bacterium]
MSEADPGWDWFESAPVPAGDDPVAHFARCFATPDGQRVLAHLRAITTGRALGPEASAAALRHLEGQRQLVRTIAALVRRGLEENRGACPRRP